MTGVLTQLNRDLGGLVAKVRPALVQVHNGGRGAGAGTVWHNAGLILTNAHVVGTGTPLSVTLPDRTEQPARLLAYDRELDLAALAIEANGLPTITLGDSQQLAVGAWVLALGHPYGVLNAVTGGTVIGTGAFLPDMPLARRDWIAVSLKMRPGHSGGSLIDDQGRLVGINTMISGPEVGLAVPAHVAKTFLKQQML